MTSRDRSGVSGASQSASANSRSVSPHANPQFANPQSDLGLDPSMATNPFSAASFSNSNPSTGADSYNYNPNFFSTTPGSQTLSGQTFPHSAPQSHSYDTGFNNQMGQSSTIPLQQGNYSDFLNANSADFDLSVYQDQTSNNNVAHGYDSSLLLDPQIQHQQAVNPADLVGGMSSPHASASPHLLPQDQSSQSQFSQHQSSQSPLSPSSSTGAYQSPHQSRPASLDPASAAYLSGSSNPDWQAMMNNASFQGHRRTPSEVSDVSSTGHSPYTSQHDYLDGVDNNASPLLAPQSDPNIYDNSFGIESFTLSDHHQQHGLSPGHSPYPSPQLMPQQGPDMVPSAPYVSAPNAQYPTPATDVYGDGSESMPGLQQVTSVPGDPGQASQMAPPSINVEFAPPSRTSSFGPAKPEADLDSLSPSSLRKYQSIRV